MLMVAMSVHRIFGEFIFRNSSLLISAYTTGLKRPIRWCEDVVCRDLMTALVKTSSGQGGSFDASVKSVIIPKVLEPFRFCPEKPSFVCEGRDLGEQTTTPCRLGGEVRNLVAFFVLW